VEKLKKVKEISIIVVLLGAGGKGLKQRRNLKNELKKMNIIAVIPEDDFAKEVPPPLIEEFMLTQGDMDLVFINVESWGSATEFGQFHERWEIAPKLRVIVEHKYHPLYGSSTNPTSYLTNSYLIHEAVYGHVYAVDETGGRFATTRDVTIKLADAYRWWKALASSPP